MANYERIGSATADIAVVVADGWHHHGVGTLMVRDLADIARRNGITTFEADILGQNDLAHRMLHDLGFPMTVDYHDGVGRYVIRLDRNGDNRPVDEGDGHA